MKHGNIENITLNNMYYRRVISTTPQQQVVIMNIPPNEEIKKEKHKRITQFVRVEGGKAEAIINRKKYKLSDGDFIVIPANTWHTIMNVSSTKDLLLYTIYSHSEDVESEHSPNAKEK